MAKTNAVKITFLIKCLAGTSPTFNQVIAFQGESNMPLATLYMAGARLVVRAREGRMKKKANTRGGLPGDERKERRKEVEVKGTH